MESIGGDRWGLAAGQARALGASAERNRVAQDLHDDVIPPLLSFIYRADDLALADQGRALLQCLRDVLRLLDSGALA